jgi:hypothetical protein
VLKGLLLCQLANDIGWIRLLFLCDPNSLN